MTKAKRRRGLLRRLPWPARVGLWIGLLSLVIVIGLLVVLRGGDNADRGGTSRFAPIHTFGTADFHSLAFSPSQDGVVLFGHHNGIQMSEDGGESWRVVLEEPNRDAMNLVYDPFSPDTVYMAGHNVYYLSEDGGETWKKANPDLPGLDLHAFAASPNEEGRLYAFAVGYGLYVSEGDPDRWRLLSADVPRGTSSVLELPEGTLLLAATDAGLLRSGDGGITWTDSGAGIETGVIFTLKGDPGGQRLYAGTNRGLFASVDGGRAWTPTSLDDTTALVVGVNPSDPLEVMVVNLHGHLFRSVDGGLTW